MPLDRILEAQTKSEKAGENPSITFFTKLSYVLMHTVILDNFNIKNKHSLILPSTFLNIHWHSKQKDFLKML